MINTRKQLLLREDEADLIERALKLVQDAEVTETEVEL